MPRPVRLFVSSSPDLAPEREALGQVAAGMPILVGWEIKHTPGPHDDGSETLAFVGSCDLFVMILGSDFAAPMGLEFQLAESAGVRSMAYRRRAMVSPSAKSMLRQSHLDWVGFDDTSQFRALIKADLAQAILDRAEYFGLRMPDVEGLLAEMGDDETGASEQPDTRRGAERGGVILGLPT